MGWLLWSFNVIGAVWVALGAIGVLGHQGWASQASFIGTGLGVAIAAIWVLAVDGVIVMAVLLSHLIEQRRSPA